MCFFKKPKPVPEPILSISAPMPQPFDYSRPIPPYQPTQYGLLPPNSVPIPPPKVYRSKYSVISPQPQQTTQPDWRHGGKSRSSSQSSSPPTTLVNSRTSSEDHPQSRSRKGSIWSPKASNITRKLFRNNGLDEHGHLKMDYEELAEPDWGEPTWQDPTRQRRPSIW